MSDVEHLFMCLSAISVYFFGPFIDWVIYFSGIELQELLAYGPAIPLLGIHTKETRIERDMSTPMFIAALFIVARTWWKQPRCPSADK